MHADWQLVLQWLMGQWMAAASDRIRCDWVGCSGACARVCVCVGWGGGRSAAQCSAVSESLSRGFNWPRPNPTSKRAWHRLETHHGMNFILIVKLRFASMRWAHMQHHALLHVTSDALVGEYNSMCAILITAGVMGVVVFLFGCYHLWLVGTNITTNESYKWKDLDFFVEKAGEILELRKQAEAEARDQ